MAARGEAWADAEKQAFEACIHEQYEAQGHPYYSSARLWDDGVIDPVDTRETLALALSIGANRPRDDEAPLGIFRM
jgi:3-methylcrotonyl-CoA carboxylase beta subunit